MIVTLVLVLGVVNFALMLIALEAQRRIRQKIVQVIAAIQAQQTHTNLMSNMVSKHEKQLATQTMR